MRRKGSTLEPMYRTWTHGTFAERHLQAVNAPRVSVGGDLMNHNELSQNRDWLQVPQKAGAGGEDRSRDTFLP
jgi:hypothetical protein